MDTVRAEVTALPSVPHPSWHICVLVPTAVRAAELSERLPVATVP